MSAISHFTLRHGDGDGGGGDDDESSLYYIFDWRARIVNVASVTYCIDSVCAARRIFYPLIAYKIEIHSIAELIRAAR